jgi:hypothetical protein
MSAPRRADSLPAPGERGQQLPQPEHFCQLLMMLSRLLAARARITHGQARRPTAVTARAFREKNSGFPSSLILL